MKNIFKTLAIAAMGLFAVSCATDLTSDVQVVDEEGVVTFSLHATGLGSRAVDINDGKKATELTYAIYDKDWNHLQTYETAFENGSLVKELTLRLVKNKTYNFVFWAQNPDVTCYTMDFATAGQKPSVSVNYDALVTNNDNYDAFFGQELNLTVSGTVRKTIELRRPFAQINFGTDDLQAAKDLGFDLGQAKVSVSTKTYSKFFLHDGAVDGDQRDVTFTEDFSIDKTAADRNLSTTLGDFHWVSMNYILWPNPDVAADANKDLALSKCEMTIALAGQESIIVEVPQAPARRNWRTNLVGSLLTEAANLTVEIKPIPEGEYNVEVPNYTHVVDGVVYDEETKTYGIQNLAGLKWFATATDSITRSSEEVAFDTANGTFEGYTVKLLADIDLKNAEWTPIASGATVFKGTFDGNKFTISNLKITKTDNAPAGLFAKSHGLIKNVNVVNVDIDAHYKAGAIVGDGLCSKIEGCTVDGGSIVITPLNEDDGNHAGGIVGYLSAEPTAYVNNCTVKNLEIVAYRDCGGVVGCTNGNSSVAVVSGNTVDNVWICANQLPAYYDKTKAANAGEVVGRNECATDISSNIVNSSNVFVEVLAFVEQNGVPTLEYKSLAAHNILAAHVDAGNSCEGQIVKLTSDIDLYQTNDKGEVKCIEPVGSYRRNKPFKGTFDGQGHTISNLNQNTWALNNGYHYNDLGMGLFGYVEDATIKDLVMDNASISGESGMCGIVAASAFGNTTFENITVRNSECADYQYYAGGIVGWAGGNHTYKNCNIEASTTIAAQWGDFDNSIGGIIGGVSSSAQILLEDCNVACRIDAYNDVTSTYQWYAYRRCGMLIGNTGKTKKIGNTTYADAPQLTCRNVTVTYGDWANYTYCEFAGTSWPYVRVQEGLSNSAYSNPRYGHPTDANGKEVVDDNHVHNEGEDHHILCIFDQLYGGGQGVYGTPAHEGVTVIYHDSYVRGVSSTTDIQNAINLGIKQLVLESDIDTGSTALTLDQGQTLDLNGKSLLQNGQNRGIILKNGASIKNGVIEHNGIVAAVRAWKVPSIENVTIKLTSAETNKVRTAIAVQQGGHVGTIKNVTIEGVSQGIEVPYQATVDLIEDVNVQQTANGSEPGIALKINGGKVGKAKNCTFKGSDYGVQMHLKGVFAVGLELENCTVEGATASISAWDEKGISNTSGSLVLTYDAATTLVGPFIWDFEDECQSVVTLNRPQ